MKVKVVLDFGDVEPASKEGIDIVNQVWESCETMQVAFDARNAYVEVVNMEEVR